MREDVRDNEGFEKNEINKEIKDNGIDKDLLCATGDQEKTEKDPKENTEGVSAEGAYNCEKAEAACDEEEGAYEEPCAGNDQISDRRRDCDTVKAKKSKKGIVAGVVTAVAAIVLACAILLSAILVPLGIVTVGGLGMAGLIFFNNADIQHITETPLAPDVNTDVGIGEAMTVIKHDGPAEENSEMSIPDVVAQVADTVVEITTVASGHNMLLGQMGGAGSGVIISENGYIVTNHHVIEGAGTITVRRTNGVEYQAAVVGSDADKDIALLKIKASGLPAAVLGSSKDIVVGQEVLAIGNPLGTLGGTVTNGIISALDRTIIIDGHSMTLLQTNAAINPGNSGGGLFNCSGQLIGIVNAKQAELGVEGLGFAIPIDVAWETVQNIAINV